MPNRVTDIQERLNEKAKKEAEEEWKQAKNKAIDIVIPILRYTYDYGTKEEREELANKIGEYFKANRNSGWVDLFNYMPCPPAYIRHKQDKATEEFVKKLDQLQVDVEQLYAEVESMQR